MTTLSKDMRDLLLLLNQHQVDYLIAGGHAVAFHGYPRLTMDLDIVIRPGRRNARRTMAVLAEFGFGEAGISENAFLRRGTAVTLGVQPNQVDLLTSVGRTDDASIFKRARPGLIDRIPVRFLALEDLLSAKREAGRAKDLADIEGLSRPSC